MCEAAAPQGQRQMHSVMQVFWDRAQDFRQGDQLLVGSTNAQYINMIKTKQKNLSYTYCLYYFMN